MIDLRSDTVTKPTKQMREAMASAEVGDDVYGEDPTVNKLEEQAAALTGKEDALFVSSGTMGNLVALLAHCGRGEEVLLGDKSHIHIHEQGGVAGLASIHTRTIQNSLDGTLELNALEKSINEDDIHCARTRLICLENTWNGRVLPLSYMAQVRTLANRHGLSIHLDGARVFNAAVNLRIPLKSIAEHVDTLQFCLSKGLSCPVGSLVCGPKAFIREARRARKAVGGGTRQAGVLAACGLIALNSMVERLEEDHLTAKKLADGLHAIAGVTVAHTETNMVFFRSDLADISDAQLAERLKNEGLLVFAEPLGIRAVTHYGIENKQIEEAIAAVERAIKNIPTRLEVK